MKRDEILARSRNEKGQMDERELQVYNLAGRGSATMGMLLCLAIAVLSYVYTGSRNYGCFAIYFAIIGTESLIKFYHLRKKSDMVFGILQFLLCASDLVAWIRSIVQ